MQVFNEPELGMINRRSSNDDMPVSVFELVLLGILLVKYFCMNHSDKEPLTPK